MNKQQRRSPEELLKYMTSIKRQIKRPNFAYKTYVKNTNANYDLISHLEDPKVPISMRKHMRHLYVAYECSALEVFLKHIIIQYSGRWREEGVDKLLTETITLAEAYNTFSKGEIMREHIIAHTNTFQSFSSIEKVFTNLYGKTFFKDISKKSKEKEGFDFEEYELSMQYHLKNLFELRNRIIHECTKEDLHENDASSYGLMVISFATGLDSLLTQTFPALRRQ